MIIFDNSYRADKDILGYGWGVTRGSDHFSWGRSSVLVDGGSRGKSVGDPEDGYHGRGFAWGNGYGMGKGCGPGTATTRNKP